MTMTKKTKNSVGYFSAYYRGLECLLDMWPKIRAEVPDATLDVYYGWESWVGLEGEDEFYHKMEARFAEMRDHGVTVHGRVSHQDLAKAMKKTQVWAYPTQFHEIHCITALKAQEAGCYPVVTNVAALAETVQSGDKLNTQRIYLDEYQQEKFVKAVVSALKEEKVGEPVENCDWSDVATQWSDFIKEKLDGRQ
jgi:glycosyltransferase involved in cell wall biosynthesis